MPIYSVLSEQKNITMDQIFIPSKYYKVLCYCISYVIGKNVFTGDSYLPGIKTVMNFPRSNRALALKNTTMLKQLEQQGFTILCGHHSYL